LTIFVYSFIFKKFVVCNGKKYITKFQTSSHSLNIERGRRQNILRSNRICNLCDQNEIEDEFHVTCILKCSFYEDLRIKYVKRFYFKKPCVFKLVKLLSVNNTKELNKLGKFLQVVKLRNSAL
jgi:hypothetical protein